MNNNETKDLSELEASLKRRLEKELEEREKRISKLLDENPGLLEDALQAIKAEKAADERAAAEKAAREGEKL